jgi:hypothetical protein
MLFYFCPQAYRMLNEEKAEEVMMKCPNAKVQRGGLVGYKHLSLTAPFPLASWDVREDSKSGRSWSGYISGYLLHQSLVD